jgi:hypothetical protein
MKLPTWKQAFVILGGSLVLSFCACFGFMVSADYADQNNFALVVMFSLGIVAIITVFGLIPYSLIVLCIRFVKALATPPPPPEKPDGPSA